MSTIEVTARRAGVLYLVFAFAGIIREFLFPTFVVSGDAAATARNITAAAMTFRLGILLNSVTLVTFIFLVWMLYDLLKGVDKNYAVLMVLLVSVGVAVAFANLLTEMVPLILLSGFDYWSVFTKSQLDALALGSLKLNGSGAAIVTAFWGLWLFPFGILVIKSGFIPRILGIMLLVAGVGYIVTSLTSIVLPSYRHTVFQVLMPLYFGEVPIIFWLVLKGVILPPSETKSVGEI